MSEGLNAKEGLNSEVKNVFHMSSNVYLVRSQLIAYLNIELYVRINPDSGPLFCLNNLVLCAIWLSDYTNTLRILLLKS